MSVADRCLTVSEGVAERLATRYYRRDVLVVKNCPPRRNATKLPSKAGAREAVGWSPAARIVVYQGVVIANRGLEELVEAAKWLRKVHIVIVGPDKPYARHLQQKAHDIGLSNVTFVGHKEASERDLIMRAADLGVVLTQDRSASYRLTLSNKIFEYFANGLPAVVSDLPPHRQLAKDTGVCTTVDPEDPAAIARGIRDFFSLPQAQRDAMSERAVAAHLAEYNMQRQIEPLLEYYRGLVSRVRESEPKRCMW